MHVPWPEVHSNSDAPICIVDDEQTVVDLLQSHSSEAEFLADYARRI